MIKGKSSMVPRKKSKMITVIKVTFRVKSKSSQGSDKNFRKLGTEKLRESSKELLAISLSLITCYYNYNFVIMVQLWKGHMMIFWSAKNRAGGHAKSIYAIKKNILTHVNGHKSVMFLADTPLFLLRNILDMDSPLKNQNNTGIKSVLRGYTLTSNGLSY